MQRQVSATYDEYKGSGRGKGYGKAGMREEHRTRTVFFKNFPDGTRTSDIKAFVNEKLGEALEKVEEVCTYDKRTIKGMARFKTIEGM